MGAVSSFLSANMFLVFFVYGLAFFVMGLVVALESRRSSGLRLAGGLVFLAAFGMLNGVVGWIDMLSAVPGLIPGPSTMPLHQVQPINCFGCHADPTLPLTGEQTGLNLFLNALKLILMVASWLSLAKFGSILMIEESSPRWLRLAPFGLLTLWLICLVPMRVLSPNSAADQWLLNAGVWARYLLLAPASAMAVLGLLAEGPRLRSMGLPTLARQCTWAAAFFGITGFAGGLVAPPAPYPPADFLNYSSFFAATGVPVQVVRAFAALAIAFSVVRVLRVFGIEYDRRLEGAIESRLEAQREALEAQLAAQQAIEAWNKELGTRVSQRTYELEVRNRELGALNSIAATISQSLNLNDVLRATLRRVLGLVGASAGAIYLLDSGSEELVLELELGTPPGLGDVAARVTLGHGCVGQAAAEGRTVRSPAGASYGGDNVVGGPTVCVPLRSKGKVLGVMSVVPASDDGLPDQEVDILEAIAGQVGVAIENARLFEQVQQLAVLEERDRIAREMHDGLAQILGYLNLRLRFAEDLLERGDHDGLRTELQHNASVTQEAYADVREAILGLRTSISLDQDLLTTLREYLRKFRHNSGIAAELEVGCDQPVDLTPAAEVQLIRIIQEALTNVRKHARATNAWVRVKIAESMAEVAITDNGKGFDIQQSAAREGHFGLQTMRERAESVGGSLEIVTAPGQGTTVKIRLPMATEGGRVNGPYEDSVSRRSRSLS